jgi:hypothetical protein
MIDLQIFNVPKMLCKNLAHLQQMANVCPSDKTLSAFFSESCQLKADLPVPGRAKLVQRGRKASLRECLTFEKKFSV